MEHLKEFADFVLGLLYAFYTLQPNEWPTLGSETERQLYEWRVRIHEIGYGSHIGIPYDDALIAWRRLATAIDRDPDALSRGFQHDPDLLQAYSALHNSLINDVLNPWLCMARQAENAKKA